MSRVAKSKMLLPAQVEIQEKDGIVTIKSKTNRNAVHEYVLPRGFGIKINDNHVSVEPQNEQVAKNVAIWGTTVRNIFNFIKGINQPFSHNVDLVGVGYKCQVQGKQLILDLGFSHKVEFNLPPEVDCTVEKNTRLTFSSFNKEKMGQVIGELSKIRPPEPYKGKGIIKEGIIVVRKEGKKKNG